jgi:hypothetical protein
VIAREEYSADPLINALIERISDELYGIVKGVLQLTSLATTLEFVTRARDKLTNIEAA